MDLKQSQTISSREIAEITGKRHSDILNAIRKMEPGWLKVSGRSFSLADYTDEQGKLRPEYILNKTESMYVGSKFNDEGRAKLVLRWELLETEKQQQVKPLSQLEILAQSAQILLEHDKRLSDVEGKLNQIIQIQEEAKQELFALPISEDEIPELSTRDKIRKMVNSVSRKWNMAQTDVWNKVYQDIYYYYHVSIKAKKKLNEKESWLDVTERTGNLDKMYTVISNIIK